MKTKEQLFEQYIKDKHTQEECIGFIDGFEAAQKNAKERLEEQYRILKKVDVALQRIRYDAMRLFCLDCNLLTFAEIERMEHELNNE